MRIDTLKIYATLHEKLGPEAAQRIIEALEFQEKFTEKLDNDNYPSMDKVKNMLAKMSLKMTYILIAGLSLNLLIFTIGLFSTR